MPHCVRSRLASVMFGVGIIVMALAAIAAGSVPLVVKASPHDVATTVKRLEEAVKARGAQVVAKIDHAAAA